MLRNLVLRCDKQNQKDKPSLESIEKFEHVHDQKEPSLGAKANIFPLDEAGDVQQLLITEKLFARALIKSFTHTKCTETIKVISPKRESDGLQTVVGALTGDVKDRVLLMNTEGNLIAVFIQNIHIQSQIYHIYGTEPIVKRQKPAKNVNHEGQPLYDWARAKIPKRDLDLTMDMVDEETGKYEPTYTIERMREKKRILCPQTVLSEETRYTRRYSQARGVSEWNVWSGLESKTMPGNRPNFNCGIRCHF